MFIRHRGHPPIIKHDIKKVMGSSKEVIQATQLRYFNNRILRQPTLLF